MTEAEDSTRVLYQQISASVKKWDFYTTHCSKLSQDPVKPKGAEKDNHSHPHPPLFFGCPTLAYRIPVPQPRTGPRPSAVKVRSPTGPPGSPNHPILTVHWDTSSTAISILSPCPLSYSKLRRVRGNFPGGPVVKNLPSNARDVGSIPGWGTKIPHALG